MSFPTFTEWMKPQRRLVEDASADVPGHIMHSLKGETEQQMFQMLVSGQKATDIKHHLGLDDQQWREAAHSLVQQLAHLDPQNSQMWEMAVRQLS